MLFIIFIFFSAKNLDEKAEWAIEEKPGQEGKDPFILRNQQKELGKLKEQKKEIKNFENSQKKNTKKGEVEEGKIKGKEVRKQQMEGARENRKNLKNNKFGKVNSKLEEDKKGLSKTLEMVQKSSASMGKFDKKLKNEKELNPLKKKKVSKDILLNRKSERERDRKVLENIIGKKSKQN